MVGKGELWPARQIETDGFALDDRIQPRRRITQTSSTGVRGPAIGTSQRSFNSAESVAMIAIARKVIILDTEKLSALTLIGIGVIILALTIGYYLVRQGHRKST